MTKTWTPEMTQDLIFFWRNGFTGEKICALINGAHDTNITRNAVLGKLTRLNERKRKWRKNNGTARNKRIKGNGLK